MLPCGLAANSTRGGPSPNRPAHAEVGSKVYRHEARDGQKKTVRVEWREATGSCFSAILVHYSISACAVDVGEGWSCRRVVQGCRASCSMWGRGNKLEMDTAAAYQIRLAGLDGSACEMTSPMRYPGTSPRTWCSAVALVLGTWELLLNQRRALACFSGLVLLSRCTALFLSVRCPQRCRRRRWRWQS